MTNVIEEQWVVIEEFPTYSVSSQGRVYNSRLDRFMRTNPNNFGHMKITLTDEETGERYDRSLAKLVAEAFCMVPNSLCDQIVVLDGDFTNIVAQNLVWRPSSFAYKYTRQLKEQQPIHYHNLRVRNINTGVEYESVIDAGIREGLLFDDIWRSTYSLAQIFPHGFVFEIIERV